MEPQESLFDKHLLNTSLWVWKKQSQLKAKIRRAFIRKKKEKYE
jgi:hypothetical protein